LISKQRKEAIIYKNVFFTCICVYLCKSKICVNWHSLMIIIQVPNDQNTSLSYTGDHNLYYIIYIYSVDVLINTRNFQVSSN